MYMENFNILWKLVNNYTTSDVDMYLISESDALKHKLFDVIMHGKFIFSIVLKCN